MRTIAECKGRGFAKWCLYENGLFPVGRISDLSAVRRTDWEICATYPRQAEANSHTDTDWRPVAHSVAATPAWAWAFPGKRRQARR